MNRRSLFSSNEIITALQRAGFELARKTKGSHQALKRRRAGGGHDVAVVVLGRKEIPEGTLRGILKQANVEYEEFLNLTKVKRKGK